MKNIKNFITETNESISKKRMLKEGLEGTDAIENAVEDAATVIADEYVRQQIGQQEDAPDNYWSDLQGELRNAMLNAAFKVCKEY